ncbi:MAG: hypothetical protein V3V02_09415 [Rhizobiaceae bacterium]
MSLIKSATIALALTLSPLTAAKADEATAKLFAAHAYGQGLSQGITKLEGKLAENSKNGEAIFGLGTLQFFHAIEGLQQDLFRYGVGNQGQGNGGMRNFLPVLRAPVPPNPKAEVASYKKVRAIFEKFVTRLEAADKTLSKMGETPAKLPFTLMKVRYDLDGDGTITDNESLASLLNQMSGRRGAGLPPGLQDFTIAFDTADAHWLRGYTNVLMSIGNFFLSFDFEKSYDASFHTIFGDQATKFGRSLGNARGSSEEIAALKAKVEEIEKKTEAVFSSENLKRLGEIRTGYRKITRDKTLSNAQKDIEKGKTKEEFDRLKKAQQESRDLTRQKRRLVEQYSALDPSASDGGWMQEVFDPISFLHSISWDVVEPDRLKTVRQNMLTVMRLNRTTWKLIQAETDNDREWLPNPKQTSPFPGLDVTQEVIDGWLKSVDAAEALLEGKLLSPHLRYGRGVNMKRFFEETKHFDLLLFLTGPNSIQLVEEGPIWDQGLMRTMSQPFGRNFGAYALWFN